MAKRVLQEKAQEIKEEEKIEVVEETAAEEKEEVEEEVKETVEQTKKKARGVPGEWVPKTRLGKEVANNIITDIKTIFSEGRKIMEPEIVDILLPNMNSEIILIGGSTGKGGGIRRTTFRRTTRMHKSGRRFRMSVMTVVGNSDGYIGLGLATGPPGRHRELIEKSLRKAKLNIIPIRRGCGSWECTCGENHSLPFQVEGKSGSVKVTLIPAPKGVGLAVSDEVKKIMRLAGISDIWCKTKGQSRTRINLMRAVFNSLRKMNAYKVHRQFEKNVGLTVGKTEAKGE